VQVTLLWPELGAAFLERLGTGRHGQLEEPGRTELRQVQQKSNLLMQGLVSGYDEQS
jgi:hypothetical protein